MGETIKKKALIVDDELNVRRLVRAILSNDYAVLEAQNGAEAVDMARRQKPDIILMDIMMPVKDGYAACHDIKADQATRNIPVVMLTAVGYELNRQLAKQVGADGYITKPFTKQDLLQTIGTVLKTTE